MLVSDCVGTLLAVGRVEDKLEGLDVLVVIVLLLDDVVAVEAVEVNTTPVNTCCKSIFVGCPLYVVSTVVAQLVSPQPY